MKYDPLGSAMELIKFGQSLAEDKARAKPSEKKDDKKPPSLEELWVKELQRRAQFDEFMKMQQKTFGKARKEWSVDHIALLFLGMMPLNWAVMYMLLK